MSSASPESTRKPSWSASQWYIDIGWPGSRTKTFAPTCAESSSTSWLTEPRGPRSHHCASRTLRTNQLTAETLRAEPVQHDPEITPPVVRRSVRQGRAHEDPHVLRHHVSAHRPGALGARDDPVGEPLELGRTRLAPAMHDAAVQARGAHVELRQAPDEVEESLARIVGRQRLFREGAHLLDVALDHREHEVVLGGEAAEDGPVADSRQLGDLVDARVGARRSEDFRGRVEHPFEISPRVGAQLGHQAASASAGCDSTSASIRATCRLRRSATKTTRLSVTRTAAPRKA